MVYVQSFWSKPFLNTDSNEYNYRVSGGFIDKRYFYYCWSLSFLSLKNLGKKIILVTDDLGKYLLVEALGMDYDEVRLEFNKLGDLSSSYWAIPKLHVYKSMQEPFLHFDGDLILYPGFKDLDLGGRDLIFEFKNESFSNEHLKSIRYLNKVLFGRTNSFKTTSDKADLLKSYPAESHSGNIQDGVLKPGKLQPCKVKPRETQSNEECFRDGTPGETYSENKHPEETQSCDLLFGDLQPETTQPRGPYLNSNLGEPDPKETHLGETNLACTNSDKTNSDKIKLDEANPEETNPGNTNPDELNPGESISGGSPPVEFQYIGSHPGAAQQVEESPVKSFQNGIAELNCGVIGGRDYKFLNEFAMRSLDLFYNNLDKLDADFLKFNKSLVNSFFEQYLLYKFVIRQDKDFCCLFEDDPRKLYHRDFFLPVNNTQRILTHFILNLKVKFSQEIERTLQLYHPEWHARINDLIDRNIV